MGANDDTFDEFRKYLRDASIKPRVAMQNAAAIADLLEWMRENRKRKRFETLRPGDLQAYIDTSKNYRRSARAHLRRFYRWLHDEGRVDDDPTLDVTPMPLPKKDDVDTLTDDQIAKLFTMMSSSDTIRVRATASLSLSAGASVSEIQRMTLDDIANTRPLRVCLVSPYDIMRIRALDGTAERALKAWLKRRDEIIADIESRHGEDRSKGALWISERTGRQLQIRQLELDVRKAGEQAGIDNCTYGVLRQTFAARLIANGDSVEDLQDALGLGSIQAVAATYGPLFDKRREGRIPPDEEWRRLKGE